MRMYKHLCQKPYAGNIKYQTRHCKACDEIKRIKKEKEDFDRMMETVIEWDDVNVLL